MDKIDIDNLPNIWIRIHKKPVMIILPFTLCPDY
jgi:hypothetical protein